MSHTLEEIMAQRITDLRVFDALVNDRARMQSIALVVFADGSWAYLTMRGGPVDEPCLTETPDCLPALLREVGLVGEEGV